VVDCLRRRDGSYLPYEHKRGKPARAADNTPGAWPSDRLQVVAYPLVLDLMELFRVTLWDVPLVGSLNRGQWNPGTDFEVTRAKVWLSDGGRRKAIGLFEDRLQEAWKHPVLNYSLSYARTIELEARLLEKEWTGEPGLFARSRLR
jgi:CRISPR-associated protein Cas1